MTIKNIPIWLAKSAIPAAKLFAGAVIAASVSGCYSATTTPSISADDVKRELSATPAAENDLIHKVAPEPPATWQSGKKWSVTDNKLQLIVTPASKGTKLPDMKGRMLTLVGIDSVPTIMGGHETELILALSPDTLVNYRTSLTPGEFSSRRSIDIPFTVDMGIVAEADSTLRGRQLYIMSSTWLDENGNYRKARKFIPVTADSVTAGSTDAPLRVYFHADTYNLSGNLLMALSSDPNRMRAFTTLFSLTDPRRSHPAILPETWELIMRGEVAQYMTRDECRLALGTPRTVDRREMFGYTRETWYYDNGVYLIFEDGILKQFRT